MRLASGRARLPSLASFCVGRLDLLEQHDLVELEGGVAPLDDRHVVEHAPLLDLLVRRLDEAVVVDPGVARERRDEADVRPFRRLDRADPAVVRRVHVADLEPGPLARQAARPERRQAALVGHLGQRVGLVHELGELGRAEELLHRRDHRLGVDEVARHRVLDVLVDGHALLDGALHPHEADAELVLEQLADGADAAVGKRVDVVDADRFRGRASAGSAPPR